MADRIDEEMIARAVRLGRDGALAGAGGPFGAVVALGGRVLGEAHNAVIATTDKAAGFVPHVRAVVPHGVDTDRFTPAPDRAAAWVALGHGGTFGIASIGIGADAWDRARHLGRPGEAEATLAWIEDHPIGLVRQWARAIRSLVLFAENEMLEASAASSLG